MNDGLKLDTSKLPKMTDRLERMKNQAETSLAKLAENNSGMTGWLDLPRNYDKEEFIKIKSAATRIRENSDVLVVIGIGGSYLGARAVVEALKPNFFNNLSADKRQSPEIYYAGNNLSGAYLHDLIELIEAKDISINVISKSGTTTEPAIAFRLFRELIEKKYGKEEAKNRIYITTDSKSGALKKLANKEGYETFVIPNNIGGRYSVLTAVGLLPIAAAGIDVDELMKGASEARDNYAAESLEANQALLYAVMRNILYQEGKKVEVLVNFDPKLHYFAEWWKQLFGESEGKDGKGIFPAAVDFTTDLHSMGQYIQEGERHLFETVLFVEKSDDEMPVSNDPDNADGLNFLSGKSLEFINRKAMEATVLAHTDGGVPNMIIRLQKLDAFYLGQLIYFFEKSCALSSYILGVDPFSQPGVEAYKNNMFALLGKPGYEEQRGEIEQRINL